MELIFIHTGHPVQFTRDILVVDTLAVEKGYRRNELTVAQHGKIDPEGKELRQAGIACEQL